MERRRQTARREPIRRELNKLLASYISLVSKLGEASSALGDALSMASDLQPDKKDTRNLALEQSLTYVKNGIAFLAREVEKSKSHVKPEPVDASKDHEALNSKLEECSALLSAASSIAAELQTEAKSGAGLNVMADRRLGLRGVIQTLGAARHHVAKTHAASVSMSRSFKELLDDSSGDSWSAFE